MIYICIPTHNEQQTVGVVLWKLREVLTQFPRDYQLLVADDASTDKTALVLEPYARVLPLTVIRAERQLGEAASLELLLREAVRRSEYPKRDVIITLQADFSDEPEDIVPLIKRIEAGADVAIGNKVSKSVAPRARRLSRTLANFFARGPKWPEDAESPFDGFRAYRLYSVKRALESQSGRLIRYGGWAGQAELLQHVLPHARRVDAVSVVDRTDRIQRERRERPFASAMSVRAMRRGVEPAGLVPVAELDRIAATASRTRDRSLLLDEAAQKSRSTGRSNGGGRARSGGGRPDRSRGAAAGPAKRERSRSAESGDRPAAGEKKKRTRGGRKRSATGETSRPAADAAPSVVDEQEIAAADGAVEETAPPKKKRRRRRKRRSGAANANGPNAAEPTQDAAGSADNEGESSQNEAKPASQDAAGPEVGAGPDSGSDSAGGASDGTATGEPGTTPRKRRRRGGRRGGRGRKRGARAGTSDSPPENSVGDGASGSEGAGGATDASSGPAPDKAPDSSAE